MQIKSTGSPGRGAYQSLRGPARIHESLWQPTRGGRDRCAAGREARITARISLPTFAITKLLPFRRPAGHAFRACALVVRGRRMRETSRRTTTVRRPAQRLPTVRYALRSRSALPISRHPCPARFLITFLRSIVFDVHFPEGMTHDHEPQRFLAGVGRGCAWL